MVSDGLKIIEEDMAADILLVGSQDSVALADFHNQVGSDRVDTGFLEAGMKDNRDFVLVAAGFHKLAAAADSNNFAADKVLQEHQMDLERMEPGEDYVAVDIDFVHAAGTAARTREVALVAGIHLVEVPEAAGFAVQELAHQRVVDAARLRLVEEDLAGMSVVGAELEDHYFLAGEQMMEEAVLGLEKRA